VRLAEQWDELERRLPERWDEAQVLLAVERGDVDRAAALLGPANPGRRRDAVVIPVRRTGGAASPEGIRRLLARLDKERFAGRLEVASTSAAEPVAPSEPTVHTSLHGAWRRALAKLPSDWSDLVAQAELRASDQVDRAALLMSPLNPSRPPDDPLAFALRFRCARRFGYGASPEMVERCLGRCDEEEIRGTVAILWALSDTHPVATQGPVWYVGGRPQ
jgi:hypothetical protein